MRAEIEQSLQQEAKAVSQNIDKMLFERLQNAQTWRRLEVTQDIKVNDIDKRLSKFLAELKSGYQDVYVELLCTNLDGHVVASSNSGHIDSIRKPAESILLGQDEGTNIRLETLQFSKTEDSAVLPIQARVPSLFNDGEIGTLYLLFNWGQIYHILDEAAQGDHDLALIDKDGRIIAASAKLRNRGGLMKSIPASWLSGHKSGIRTINGTPFYGKDVIIGFDRSSGFQRFPGFDWTTLVIKNSHRANIPVRQMALVFLLLLALTSAIAISFSYMVAGRISRPIAALTNFTRRFTRDKQLPELPQAVGGEVGELTEAFVQTVKDLDQSRADMVRASKLAVLGELAAVMAHEIRTPIGILRSSAQMLSREPNLSTEARELTSFVESETERLNRLVSTLLDSARPPAPRFQQTDIHTIIGHSIDMLAGQTEKKHIAIIKQLESKQPFVQADIEQITQVLLNLVLNALQILPEGGKVVITTRDQADRLIIEIADDGPGIAPEEIGRVFDPFFTKREGGVGLGLAVVQQIVAAHGGEIHAGSSELGGALFTIVLPRKDKP